MPKSGWGRLSWAAVVLGLFGIVFAQPAIRPRRKITLTVQGVPLSAADPQADRVGSLRFLGGLALRSADPGFGGLSGLIVDDDGPSPHIVAVTDEGDKLSGRLVLADGRLRGFEAATLEPLLDEGGRPVSGKSFGDAESITRLGDGRVLVGFERRHRVWAYGPGLTGSAHAFETPFALQRAPSNGGLESLANWPDGRVLAITEQLATGDGNRTAFLFQGAAWTSLEWRPSGPGFEPSDATTLPDGDLLVLERFWSAFDPMNPRSRIVRVRGDSVRPGALVQGSLVAELQAPLIAGNFEGIAAGRGAGGVTHLLLVSDDNFSRTQRTLLLWFELPDRPRTSSP